MPWPLLELLFYYFYTHPLQWTPSISKFADFAFEYFSFWTWMHCLKAKKKEADFPMRSVLCRAKQFQKNIGTTNTVNLSTQRYKKKVWQRKQVLCNMKFNVLIEQFNAKFPGIPLTRSHSSSATQTFFIYYSVSHTKTSLSQ